MTTINFTFMVNSEEGFVIKAKPDFAHYLITDRVLVHNKTAYRITGVAVAISAFNSGELANVSEVIVNVRSEGKV